ncbi:hypothetical protein [Ornithinibacillus contaminans]|uniref:hypothetical protein n=1 Tax=Ornithinibacillus contaminans TaxID=694055 RepID=UPI00064DF4AE|nr:hypothetical protein [Ornithinibacillus contaminans]
MSFFIVQVQSNHEITVQKTLAYIFSRKKEIVVRSIYALDTHTALSNSSQSINESNEDVRFYLYQQRLREQLNTMRYAYAKIDKELQPALKQEYRDKISNLTKEVRSNQSLLPKNKTVISGYIIIELDGNFNQLPNSIYYDIKSVPKVIGVPSPYNVPLEEMEAFFKSIRDYYIAT